ncbi:hypothetical protein RBB50_001539 [Rhinocladiella similis]
MKSSRLIFYALLALLGTSMGSKTACANACQTVAADLVFTSTKDMTDYYAEQCVEALRDETLFVCMRSYCTDKEVEAGIAYYIDYCQKYGSLDLLPYTIIDNITTADVQKWPQIEPLDLLQSHVYETPVYITAPLFQLSLRTIVEWDNSLTHRANYGYAMFGFFGIVILIGAVARLINLVQIRLSGQSLEGTTTPSKISGLQRLAKRYITTPALVLNRAAEPVGWCTVPPRLQSVTIAAFVIVNVVLCCVEYRVFKYNLYWPSIPTQLWRYIADRTGVISLANLVLIWAFGTRNNVLIWLTGWNFSTFNQFHRWAARVATIEAILHSIGYTVLEFRSGGKKQYYAQWSEQYWWMGAVATVTMSLLVGASIHPVRKYVYDAFLMIHIALALLTLVAMFYHVKIMDGEYNPYIWACVAVWSFDRALRIGRIALLNRTSFRATAKYNPESDVVRIEVPVRIAGARPSPGTYYYLYSLHGTKFWESHPFTLAAWNTQKDATAAGNGTLSFIVRPHDGFTARLRNYLVSRQDKEDGTLSSEKSLRVAIEGPYGPGHNVEAYDSALFIIGGMGITVALAYIQALCEKLTSQRTLKLRKLYLVWSIRDIELFRDVYERDLSHHLAAIRSHTGGFDLQIALYLTRQSAKMAVDNVTVKKLMLTANEKAIGPLTVPAPGNDNAVVAAADRTDTPPSSSSSSLRAKPSNGFGNEDDPVKATKLAPSISVFENRPRVQDIIAAGAQECRPAGGKLAVVCCGPASLADDTRAAVVEALGEKDAQIDFFPEFFDW